MNITNLRENSKNICTNPILERKIMKYDDALKEVSEYEYDLDASTDKNNFDEYLDEIYGIVEIAGMSYNTSQALEELDPTAYRCMFADYSSELPKRFECSFCGEIFETREEAVECCTNWYECESCGEKYETEEESEECCTKDEDENDNE